MKKVDLSVTKQNNVDVVRYELKAADVFDERVQDKVSQISNIVPFQYSDEDGKRSITSYVKDAVPVDIMLKKTLDKKSVLSIVSGLASAFEIGAQGVPVSYIVKDTNYIYIDENNMAVKCILLPLKQDVMPMAELPLLFRDILSKMRYDEKDKDNYVARLFTLVNSDEFSVSKLKDLTDKELEQMGFFISKDNGLMDMNAGKAPVTNNEVKVNKLGVMNNMMGGQPPMPGQPPMMGGRPPMPGTPQAMMGQPPMQGQPAPQPMMGGRPPMPGQPPMQGQPVPQPMMGGRPPMPGQPPMQGQPAPQPMMGGRPPMPGQPPMQGQPVPQPMMGGQPPMPGQPPMMGKPPVQGQPVPQPMMGGRPPMPGQPPMQGQPVPQPMMGGQPPMMGKTPVQGQPVPQPMMGGRPPMPGTPQAMPGQPPMMGQPPMQGMPKPAAPAPVEAPKPVAPEVPAPAPVEAPKPVAPEVPAAPAPVEAPKPAAPEMPAAPAPVEAPKPAAPEMPNPAPAEAPKPGEFTMGNLVGQLGVKPVPHIIRKKTGEAINITKPEFTIGKSKTKADYAIENNTAISRVHCIIVQKDGVNYIKDNNSTNHTYVNGVELEPGKEVLLKNKTVIQLGDEEFTFLLRKGE